MWLAKDAIIPLDNQIVGLSGERVNIRGYIDLYLLGEFERETPGRSLTIRTESNPYKRMTPLST